ncbi:AraC family transcriptional regulator [Paenibacillus baekrokdamisoli]|uniref:AraC family transcriptional regulator n=1 Tax=Paenibacillus baekrokdamisoli TaxID=1712516 RepID=A0A3G9JGN5_9BACL|nr:response regulator [Paenibacillus baekrokdamisoli]MBB3069382.1 two-component system response regulator YesN [Paenibacillus baekrokdamisoli]BBH25061.1 AraC family transcriptional regulator [Paenibacillus baekrokdamisoli]
MYNLLIVDNERIDREGIKLLIHKYKLPLNIAEADSGRHALAYLESHHVDILLSDIKMPLMDGLELAQRAREMKPMLKIVIFSAYGEFDYAKQAIHIGVAHYILKPIRVDEFLKVMEKVLAHCEEEENVRRKNEVLLQGYHKGIQYEKEKVLMDILQGAEADDQRIAELGIQVVGRKMVLILLDFKERFFDTQGLEFEQKLQEMVHQHEFEYLNLNEYQSILFIMMGQEENLNQRDEVQSRDSLELLGETLKNGVARSFHANVCIVISNYIRSREEIHTEYVNMEKVIENKFFYDRSVLLFSSGKDTASKNSFLVELEPHLEHIHRYIEKREYKSASEWIERFFAMMQKEGSLSVVYIKFLCTEMMKKLFKSADRHHELIPDMAENIYAASNLQDVKSILMQIVQQYDENNAMKVGGKLIADVLEVIHQEYMNDISLEVVSEKVYLSPSYLSHLFKKETGQSFMKYVTSYRFEKSLELLANTNMRISDISREVGYNSHSYFCSIFKNYYGISPAQYRERRR